MASGVISVSAAANASFGEPSGPIFTDATRQAGITWRHFNGESPDRFLIEATTGGVGFLDFDGDGVLDIYFVNGGETPRGKSPAPVRNALYRNLGHGRFEDVAAAAGVDRMPFFGMGVAAADYDNDGFQDLYVTGYPACALFHNNGRGRFTDVTERAGVRNAGKWAASAAWFDYDRDGFLDLFVCNYARLSFDHPLDCEYRGQRTYCEQKDYEGEVPTLYHNNGNGTFTDVTARAGLAHLRGRALGVVAVDVDDDGWPDLFVARDASPNLLLMNQRDGTFKDTGLMVEIAYNSDGIAKSGMGVDAGDVNGDGRPDFVVTNFNDEYHSLFINRGSGPFDDRTVASHLASMTRSDVGWGTHFLDYDNNGVLDLVIVNGHVNPIIELTRADVKYKELPLLLRNDGKGTFESVASEAGHAFLTPRPARGLAVGDFDNDGDTDLVFVCLKESPVLLRNDWGDRQPWIGFELRGTRSNRDAIGSKLVLRAGGQQWTRWITGGASFLATHDKRVRFGLGAGKSPASLELEVRWPSGKWQRATGLAPGRYHRIVESP